VPREKNERVDVLSKLAYTRKVRQHQTLIQETLSTASWDYYDVLQVNLGSLSWITHINFLTNDYLLDNITEAKRVHIKASFYTMYYDEFF